MKTRKNLFLTYSGLLILLSVLAFTTCKAGLGESVDTTPPKMNIAYPPANSIIRDWFMMSGLAEDETFVKDVTVVFKGKETHTFKADVDKEKKQWTLKANTKSDGRYPIADGQYEVTVTATDSAGRKTSAKITYYIDNTPPVLVLQRPSTKGSLTPDLAEPFGEEIKFTGNWWDENANDGCDLKIRFYDYEEPSVSYGTVETTLPTQNWEYIISQGDAYNALKEKIGNEGKAKPFGYTLSLSDDAKQWQTPETNMATSEVGNLSEHYYIYVDLIRLLRSGEKYPKLIELSAFDKDPTSSNIVSGIKDGAEGIRIPCDLTSWNNEMGLFSFDPYSKAPSIEIDGLKVPVGPDGEIKLLDVGNPVQPNPIFNIKINPNKDGDALKIEDVKVKYQIINNDDEENPSLMYENVEIVGEDLKYSTIGEGYVINFSVPEATRPFRLSVNVKDLEGNEKTVMYDVFINDGAPAFKKIYPDKSPSVTKVNSFTESGKEIFIVNIEGYDGQKTVDLIIKDKDQKEIQNESNKVNVTKTVSEKINDVYEYKWIVKVITDGNGDEHKLQFFLDDGEYLSNRPPITFKIDNMTPVLKSLEKPVDSIIIPVVDSTLISDQSVYVKGYADEDLEKALLCFVKAEEPEPSNKKENLGDWTEASIDNNPTNENRGFTGQVPLDKGSEATEGKYTLYACFADGTYDKDLENYGPVQKVLTVLYDKADPTFTETESLISGAALEYKKDNVHFGGKVSDANGIDSVTLTINNDEDNKIDIKPASGDDWTFTLKADVDNHTKDNTYELTFIATDRVGKTTSITRNIGIDTKAPELEITSPSSDNPAGSKIYTIKGTVDDNGGKGVKVLEYRFGTTGDWTGITPIRASWSKEITIPGIQGEKTLYVRASDDLNPATEKFVTFQYDETPPTLAETTVNTTNTQYQSSNISFEGTLIDTNALAENNALTVSINDGEAEEIDVDASGNWDYEFDVNSRDDGTYTLVFTGTDIAGKTASLTRTVMVDKTSPSAPDIEPIETYVENSLSISGTASDGGSGVFKTYYRIDGNEGDTHDGALTGTDNWFKNITLTGFAEGDHKVYVWSEDRAGNKSSESSQDFKIDKSGPTFTETKAL